MSVKKSLFGNPSKVFIKNEHEEFDAEFVRNLRLELKLTQSAFADAIGVTKKAVEKWEQGANKVSGSAMKVMMLLKRKPELVDYLTDFKEVKEISKDDLFSIQIVTNKIAGFRIEDVFGKYQDLYQKRENIFDVSLRADGKKSEMLMN